MDEIKNFNTDLSDIVVDNKPQRSSFQEYLCKLEGHKVRLKNLHWAADCMSVHTMIDDIVDSLNEFEDEIAEVYQGIYYKFDKTFLVPFTVEYDNIYASIDILILDTKIAYSELPEGNEFNGIKGEFEDFLNGLYKYKYLLKISRRGGIE